MRGGIVIASCLAVLAGSGHAHAATEPSAWANPSIRAVTAAGLMGAKDVSSFRAGDPLTAQALENLAFELGARFAPAPEAGGPGAPIDPTVTGPTQTTTTVAPPSTPSRVADPGRPVAMWELDARLVGALGLAPAAAQFATAARAAGLLVSARFGTEVVARLLGLRLDHPARDDAIELRPQDTASRAEAAYSVAQVLRFSGREVPGVEDAAASFTLPPLSGWQRRILNTAVARIGMPYVWGGVSDGAQSAFGVSSRGGYDCSGFVWRVYKLQWYPGEGTLASTLRGRTTFEMSGEVPRSRRIPFAQLQPADVIFFGGEGPRSQPAQVDHMGVYLGDGWFIHSSGYGVALATLDGWYRREFAWGRRPLAEAGLS